MDYARLGKIWLFTFIIAKCVNPIQIDFLLLTVCLIDNSHKKSSVESDQKWIFIASLDCIND